MTDVQSTKACKLFVACMEFHDETEPHEVAIGDVLQEEGEFQIVLLARDVPDAIERLKARLDEIAHTSEAFGPILVWVTSVIEIGEQDLAKGVLVNHAGFTDDCTFRDALPEQGGLAGSEAHWLDDPIGLDEEPAPDAGKPFWSGVDVYWSKWKLYWCETDDHDEDWFVIARNARDAESFHVDAEGYDEDDARAQLVCVLPATLQEGAKRGWPSSEQIVACGGEFLPNVPQDGLNDLRACVGSGSRVVKFGSHVFAEGDIVGNQSNRDGKGPRA